MRQLEFQLDGSFVSSESAVNWSVEWDRGCLVEKIGGETLVYGTWSKLFGVWRIDRITGRSEEVLPSWPVLDDRGIWRSPEEVSVGYRTNSTPVQPFLLRSVRAAFALLLSDIPAAYRLLASRFENYQWLVLDLIWQQPEFAKVIDEGDIHGFLQKLASELFKSNAPILNRRERHDLVCRLMDRHMYEWDHSAVVPKSMSL